MKLPRIGKDINIRDIKKLHSHGSFMTPTRAMPAENSLGTHWLTKGPVVGARPRRAGGGPLGMDLTNLITCGRNAP